MCGCSPCVNPSFCAVCRRADREHVAERQRMSGELARTRRLLSPEISFEQVWDELNGARSYPTPRSTIEAILHCVRAHGVAALKEWANVERLSRCDADARAEIDRRIGTLMQAKEAGHG
jgi:hypothetical protein